MMSRAMVLSGGICWMHAQEGMVVWADFLCGSKAFGRMRWADVMVTYPSADPQSAPVNGAKPPWPWREGGKRSSDRTHETDFLSCSKSRLRYIAATQGMLVLLTATMRGVSNTAAKPRRQRHRNEPSLVEFCTYPLVCSPSTPLPWAETSSSCAGFQGHPARVDGLRAPARLSPGAGCWRAPRRQILGCGVERARGAVYARDHFGMVGYCGVSPRSAARSRCGCQRWSEACQHCCIIFLLILVSWLAKYAFMSLLNLADTW